MKESLKHSKIIKISQGNPYKDIMIKIYSNKNLSVAFGRLDLT